MGKIFAVLAALVLLCCAVVYRYVGGQTRTAEKFFSAAASGNYKNYVQSADSSVTEKNGVNDLFRDGCKAYFESLPEFAEMGETDIISSKIKIKERSPISLTEWRLTVDADFFSSGKSVSYDGMRVTMKYEGGKWVITEAELAEE
ncbi:MAG: hypothetical protein NC078_01085 [Ruminococcus sp.]|nr:hypothetical protein [Ruminococcus sp.]